MNERIMRLLPRSNFARGVAYIAGATALAQLVTLGASPILTRLYSPGDFGILAAYSAVLALIVAISSLRYEMAIPLPADDADAADVLVLSVLIASVIATISGLVAWGLGDEFAAWVEEPAIGRYTWLIPIGVFLAGSYGAFNMWAIRKRAFGRIGQTRLTQVVGMVSTQIGVGAIGAGPIGLIAGHIVGTSAGISTLVRKARSVDGLSSARTSFGRLRRVADRYRRFPLLSSWSALLNAGGLQLPSLLLLAFYDAELLGWYALALRALGMPTQLISGAVAQVFVGETAALVVAKNYSMLERRFWRTTRQLLIVGIPVVSAIALPAPLYFPWVFGAEWETAGKITQLLAPMLLAGFVVSPLGGVLDVLERQDLHLLREVVRTGLSLGVLLVLVTAGAPPLVAVAGLSIAGTLGYVFGFFVAQRAVSRATKAHSQ